MASVDDLKRAVGREAVDRFVVDGMRLGLGTGSTAIWAVRRTAERFASGELTHIRVVATSLQSELEARSLGLPVVTLNDAGMEEGLDLTIDGADEVTEQDQFLVAPARARMFDWQIATDRDAITDRHVVDLEPALARQHPMLAGGTQGAPARQYEPLDSLDTDGPHHVRVRRHYLLLVVDRQHARRRPHQVPDRDAPAVSKLRHDDQAAPRFTPTARVS